MLIYGCCVQLPNVVIHLPIQKIVDKVDKDDDGKITSQELKDWIKLTQMQHHLEVATKRWEDMKEREIKLVSRSDFKGDKSLDPKGPVTWDRYKKIHYGANPEQHEDAERLLKQIKVDERRWKEADRDQDGTLSKDEYPAFYQPWEYNYMHGVAAQENLENIDTDKDGRVSLEEYLATVHRKSESEMTEDELEQKEADKDYFRSSRDANKDGYLDLDEVKEWMFPTSYDYLESEVSHLIYHADTNKDEHLTKDEVLDNYDLFVGSRATNYGTDLTRHDEF